VILDVSGYFVPATDPTALAFYPIAPCRVADTRDTAHPLHAGETRPFVVVPSACNIPFLPLTPQTYSLNLTVIPNGPLSYLTAWPFLSAQPGTSTLNALTGTVTANAALVTGNASPNEMINVYATNATDLAIDANGYFMPMTTGGLSLYNVTPCRVLDTRQPTGTPPFSGQLDVAVSGAGCGIPATAKAYVLSATVVPAGALGYLTLWPQGQAQPTSSTLNALDLAVTSNLAIVPTANGSISVFASNPTHLVLDIFAYFAP
jgi:hypothetical protein